MKPIAEWDGETLHRGWTQTEDGPECIFCGKHFSHEVIYPVENRLLTARGAVAAHLQKEHGGLLQALMQADDKYLGLTEHQLRQLELFAAGMTDGAIADTLGITVSTVRHSRFIFREKAKQARLYLAAFDAAMDQAQALRAKQCSGEEAGKNLQRLLQTVEETSNKQDASDSPQYQSPFLHETAPLADDRYAITQKEADTIIKNCFSSLSPLRLTHFPPKEKKKVVILSVVMRAFESDRQYTEAEINRILSDIYPEDYVTLRRYLIEYGHLDRTRDCSRYWVRKNTGA